ncbi:hypothetical protein [Microbacterium capsulatum]|uniref:Uncharacterized protein n=1 Tax=Microbacterium capsulatum TaxID=3041921 RepID=A0ABU0XDN2_9MICO|nr:hypothetical protein [Microbacterium sp. ASV81]MDQ4213224.1 hypothetical protein [Microbacterium sp. ASV81]
MNTALHASHSTESKHLSLQLPREEELRRLSLTERLALRVALHLIVRAGSAERTVERAQRAETAAHVLAEHEAQRIQHSALRPLL